jgi:hypothetical protein
VLLNDDLAAPVLGDRGDDHEQRGDVVEVVDPVGDRSGHVSPVLIDDQGVGAKLAAQAVE